MSNVISSITILNNVNRVFKFSDRAWMNDAIQSIGEAIKSIGTYLPMEETTKCIRVSNMRASLPKDFLGLRRVFAKGTRINFDNGTEAYGTTNLGQGYRMNPGYILCPFLEGTIDIVYMRLPVDERGLPLILNQQDYIDAVKWKVVADLILGGYEHKVVSWRDAEAKWERDSGRAANAAKMPTVDEMEAFGQSWTRLFHDRDFEHIQLEEGLPEYKDTNKLA